MTAYSIPDHLTATLDRIKTACQKYGRPSDAVSLLAVSKTFPAQAVTAAAQAGQTAFGENYIQEGVEKIELLQGIGLKNLQWHCIGPVQSNKSKSVAEHFNWVHTVDRFKIAQRLSAQRPENLPALNVLIQINVDEGANKSGLPADQALELAQQILTLPQLQLRGVMAIPEPHETFDEQLAVNQRVKAVFDHLHATLAQTSPAQAAKFDTLSLGMTSDLEAAIAAGSTMVRVGSGIFGHRDYSA